MSNIIEFEKIALEEVTHFTKPLLWRIVVTPLKARTKIGNILLPDQAENTQKYHNHIGVIVAMGETAYCGKFHLKNPPKVGDYVNFGKWCGVAEKVTQSNGEELDFLILNENDIIGIIDTLEGRKPIV